MSGIVTVELKWADFTSLQVISATERHRLMQPSIARVVAALDDHHSLDDLVGQAALVVTSRPDGSYRAMRGVITEGEVRGSPPRDLDSRIAPVYELVVESRIALLSHHIDCRIFQPTADFQNRTQDIVTLILTEHGIAADQLKWTLSGTYAPRQYCTQYEESSLHFIQRLLEEDGIFFACLTDDDGNELYDFRDTSPECEASTPEPVPLRALSAQGAKQPAVYALDDVRSYFSGSTARRSYFFENPPLMPEARAEDSLFNDLETYSALERFSDESAAQHLSTIRQQADTAEAQLGRMGTDSFNVRAGKLFDVQVDPDTVEHYFVTALETAYRYNTLVQGEPGANFFETEAIILRSSTPYRPPVLTLKPRIVGPQSALVVAPKGSENESVHTDQYGRVKVQFHWDRYGVRDDQASCWMRVAQLQTSGSMVLPRVHWEVMVEFEDGDPDLPLVTGRLFNGLFMPPYQLPEGRTRTSLQTSSSPAGGGTNEIRFEDAAGSEEVMIRSQYNTAIAAANNRKTNVTKDETLTVANNEVISIGSNQTCKVSQGCEVTVGADRSLTVAGNHNDEVNAVYGVTVGGNQNISVGGNWMQMIGSPLDAVIALGAAKAAAVASAQAEKVFAEVSGAAQGALDAVSAPVQGMIEQTEDIGGNMRKVADGKLAAGAAVLTGAVALPTAADMFRNMSKVPAFARTAPGAGASSGEIAMGGAVGAAVSGNLMKKGKELKTAAMGAGEGSGGGNAGGTSAANAAGPAGDLAGFSSEDMTTGPGFSQQLVSGNHEETVTQNRMAVAVEPVNRNIAGSCTQQVSAAHIELIGGDRAESVEGAVTESQPALVIVTKGGEVESSNGPRQLMVGAALMETVKGDLTIEGGAAASLTAAVHEMKAKGKITLKCGASSITIEGSGVTFQSPAFSLTGSKVTAKKSVSDG